MASIRKRQTNDGQHYYTVVVRIKGHRPVIESFKRLTDARIWAQKTEADIRKGSSFPERAVMEMTVSDLIERYKISELTGRKTESREKYILDWWDQQIGHIYLHTLTPSTIVECRDRLATEGRDGTALETETRRKYMIYFKRMCKIASTEWDLLPHDPTKSIRNPSAGKGRDRVLNKSEIVALLAAAKQSENKGMYAFTLVALCCGGRWDETRTLEWQDVKSETLTFRDTKNGETRTVHAPQQVLDEIAKLKNKTSFVFPSVEVPGQSVNPRKAWETIRQKLAKKKIPQFTYHDLRHTCATRMAESGATLMEMMAVFGWKTVQMAKRYCHLNENSTKLPIAKMNTAMFAEISECKNG